MAKKDKTDKKERKLEETPEEAAAEQTAAEETAVEEAAAEDTAAAQSSETEALQKKLDAEHDAYLRLAAEYDNFRKRSQKEREALYTDIKAENVGKFLPVYDNLERALANETADEAYKKGVEMTMAELRKIMDGLGVTEFGEKGESFDPNLHNAVMHIEDESMEKNVIAQVFQKGFRVGDKVVRFAMVQVAN